MKFESFGFAQKFGKFLGFLIAYFLFTAVLFFVLSITKKIPSSWNIFYVAGITLSIVFFGIIIKKLLYGDKIW
jgi:hypothetical protein